MDCKPLFDRKVNSESFDRLWHSADVDGVENLIIDLLEQESTEGRPIMTPNPYGYACLAHIDLIRGDLASGYRALYYLRMRFPELWPRVVSELPLWTGQSLKGQSLHLTISEGVGDTIHYLRYASVLKEMYADLTVTLMCGPEFVRLAESCDGLDVAWTEQDEHPEEGYFIELLTLPHFCRTKTVADIPAGVPYLHPEQRLVDGWKRRLASALNTDKRKVAICWQGNPAHKNDARRSVPVEFFAGLARPGVQLFSVQKNAADVPEGVVPLALGDYADTAALLSLMDLTITVDTSVAHLAGALGLPVWIALPKMPDYRWLLDRSDSPWYPTARLFRQIIPGCWNTVFAEIEDALHGEQGHSRRSA